MNQRCPINSIKFIHKKGRKDEKGYTYLEFNAEYDLAFSKSEPRLPFTSFSVGEEIPCMDRFTALSVKKGDYEIWQLNEFEQPKYSNPKDGGEGRFGLMKGNCIKDVNSNLYMDPRYVDLCYTDKAHKEFTMSLR